MGAPAPAKEAQDGRRELIRREEALLRPTDRMDREWGGGEPMQVGLLDEWERVLREREQGG
jgi:hypothetical protein